jgi:tellurite resistance protein
MKKATFLCALMETCKTISILSNVVSPSEFEENLLAAQNAQGVWYVFTYMCWLRMTLV